MAVQLLTVVATMLPIPATRLLHDAHGRLLLACSELVLLVLLVAARFVGRTPALQVCFVIAGLAIMTASVAAADDPGLSDAMVNVTDLVGITPLTLMLTHVLVDLRRSIPAIVATAPVYLGLCLAIDGGEHLRFAIDSWPTSAAFAAATGVIWPALRRAGADLDDLETTVRVDAEHIAAATQAELAAEESRRIIHDDVISALRAVELDLPPESVVTGARAALAALTSGPVRTATRDELLSEIAAVPEVDVTVAGDWDEPAPPAVMTAMRGAIREALRNVRRHAGVRTASINFAQDGDTRTVEIVDRGRGFRHARRGFGTVESIEARVRDVGGRTRITSGPGGTTVRLAWSPSTRTAPLPQFIDRRRTYLQIAAFAMAAQLLLVARFPGSNALLSALVWLAVTGVVFATAWYVGGGSPSIGGMVLVTAVSCALTWLGLELQPPDALTTPGWWPLSVNMCAPLLYAVELPLWCAVVPALALSGTVAAYTARDTAIPVLQPIGLLMAPIAVIGGGAIFGEVLRRGSRDVARATLHQREQLEELAWRAGLEQARRRHLDTLATEVVPFLRAVAEDPAAADPQEASVLAEGCRDQLYLDEPMSDDVRRALRAARLRGVRVVLHVAGERWRATSAWPVLTAVADATREGLITVRPPDRERRVEIAVVPPLPPAVLAGLVDGRRVEVHADSEASVIRVVVEDAPQIAPRRGDRATIGPGGPGAGV